MNVVPEEKIICVSSHQRDEVAKRVFDAVWFCGFCFKIMLTKFGWT